MNKKLQSIVAYSSYRTFENNIFKKNVDE